MANLTGSPLGLTNLTTSSNVGYDAYNNGSKQPTGIIGKDGENIEDRISLFTGKRLNKFWPNIGKIGTEQDTSGLVHNKWENDYKGIDRTELHNDSVYDTSITNIIDKLESCPRARLKPLDFAYLKDLGVYPNNRLMIARRFTNPVKDNIMDKKGTEPLAVLISWKPENEDFFSFSFGEQWQDEEEGTFTSILNGIGSDFLGKNMGSKLGGYLEGGAGAIPLPGFSEVAQRKFFEKIGILEKDAPLDILPAGNPNIIRMAKRRKLVDSGQVGSGLKCDISIEMKVRYEQKFIYGIDPTIAWMDILSNALSFGTSNSSTYGLSETFKNKLDQWSSNPKKLIDDLLITLQEQFSEIMAGIKKFIENPPSIQDVIGDVETKAGDIVKNLKSIAGDSINKIVRKYKVKIMAVANVLSGAPSTPWHITIGNPLRPLFCSGDMYIGDSVSVKMGSTLAFNDLPSNIEVTFSLKNARPLGMQEILAKFNTGYLRISNVRKSFLEFEDIIDQNVITDVKSASYTLPLELSKQEESDAFFASEADRAITGQPTVLGSRDFYQGLSQTTGGFPFLNKTTKESDFQPSSNNYPWGSTTKFIPKFSGFGGGSFGSGGAGGSF